LSFVDVLFGCVWVIEDIERAMGERIEYSSKRSNELLQKEERWNKQGRSGKEGEKKNGFFSSPRLSSRSLHSKTTPHTQKKRTEQYSNSPSNTGQSASPTLPMLNRRI